MKKKLIIIGAIISLIIISLIFGILIKNILSKENEEPKDIVVEVTEAELSIFEVGQTEKDFEVEEKTEVVGDVNITIGENTISDNLGTNIILKQNYCHLRDEYYLLEILIAKKEGLEYKTDAELSTSYDYCREYGKVWYIYNDKTKEKYIFEDNSVLAQLSLNPKITEDEYNTYFEFDKMFYFAGDTDVDHYRISIDDLISLSQSNSVIDFNVYSTIDVPNFTKDNLIKLVEASEDLNLDGSKDSIRLEVFDSFSDFNKIGFKLTINDSFIEIKNVCTLPIINFLDLDKNDKIKEVLIISASEEESDIQEWKIFSYDGNKIFITFDGEVETNTLEIPKEVNFIDSLTLEDDGYLRLKGIISDTVQNWEVMRKYALNESHILYEIVPDFYINQKEQKVISKEDIVLYDEMSYGSISEQQIYQGQEVTLEGTTFDYWFVISIEGENFYIPLEKNGTIKDLELFPFQVFMGLEATD